MTFKEIKAVLKRKRIGIAGCGGLGSNAAVALARTGIGKLVLVDFDIIQRSNLNRQYYYSDQLSQKKAFTLSDNLYFVNPATKVEAHGIRLTADNISSIFKKCDIIIEAFDDADQKQMLIETVQKELPKTPIICGIGMAGYGNNNSLRTEQYGNLYICGDFETEISEDQPPLAPRVGIVANMQANLAVEILLKEHLLNLDT